MSRHRTPPALAAERRTPISADVVLEDTWAELLGLIARVVEDANRAKRAKARGRR